MIDVVAVIPIAFDAVIVIDVVAVIVDFGIAVDAVIVSDVDVVILDVGNACFRYGDCRVFSRALLAFFFCDLFLRLASLLLDDTDAILQ